jgi:hypothetical protein
MVRRLLETTSIRIADINLASCTKKNVLADACMLKNAPMFFY